MITFELRVGIEATAARAVATTCETWTRGGVRDSSRFAHESRSKGGKYQQPTARRILLPIPHSIAAASSPSGSPPLAPYSGEQPPERCTTHQMASAGEQSPTVAAAAAAAAAAANMTALGTAAAKVARSIPKGKVSSPSDKSDDYTAASHPP